MLSHKMVLLLLGIFILVSIIFILSMMALRCYYFDKNGKNKGQDWIDKTDKGLLGQANEYHNKATYKAYEFYIKVMLAIMGGMGYLVLNPSHNENLKILVQAGVFLTMLITVLFCALIIVHQKSKIIRWEFAPKWYSPFLWNEYWFVSISITLAGYIYYLFNYSISLVTSCPCNY